MSDLLVLCKIFPQTERFESFKFQAKQVPELMRNVFNVRSGAVLCYIFLDSEKCPTHPIATLTSLLMSAVLNVVPLFNCYHHCAPTQKDKSLLLCT